MSQRPAAGAPGAGAGRPPSAGAVTRPAAGAAPASCEPGGRGGRRGPARARGAGHWSRSLSMVLRGRRPSPAAGDLPFWSTWRMPLSVSALLDDLVLRADRPGPGCSWPRRRRSVPIGASPEVRVFAACRPRPSRTPPGSTGSCPACRRASPAARARSARRQLRGLLRCSCPPWARRGRSRPSCRGLGGWATSHLPLPASPDLLLDVAEHPRRAGHRGERAVGDAVVPGGLSNCVELGRSVRPRRPPRSRSKAFFTAGLVL